MTNKRFCFLFINVVNNQIPEEICFPNLGLGYLAASLRRKFPLMIDFKIIDNHIEEEIVTWKPNIVGITTTSQYYNTACKYASIAKAAGLPVLIGGAHISALPNTLTNDMDIGIIGEGEQTIVDLMRLYLAESNFNNKPALEEIHGIAFRDRDRIAITPPRELIQPLDNLPFPARDILTINKSTSMFTSRGCPYRCIYCFSARFWGRVRFFSAEYVVEEIEHIYKTYKVTGISLLDDLFIADTQRLIDIVGLLSKKNLLGKISYVCNVRSNLVTDDLARVLHILGVRMVGIGIESGCQSTLEYLKGKGNITVEDHTRTLKMLRHNSIHPHPSFIIGSPQESREDILQTCKFIEDNKITDFEIYVLIPFPGTPVWDYAKSRGLVSDNMDWSRLYWNFGTNPNPVILSERLTRDKITSLYQQLIDRKEKYIRISQVKAMLRQGFRKPWAIPSYVFRRCTDVFHSRCLQ